MKTNVTSVATATTYAINLTTILQDIGLHSDAVSLDLFDKLIGLWIPGMLSVFGILGNALSLWVLSRDRFGGSTAMTSLKALAASDLVLLIGALFQQVVPLICQMALSRCKFCMDQGYAQVYAWPVVCAAQMASVWLTVLISTERYFAICLPLEMSRVTGGVRKVRLAIVAIVTVSAGFNLPRFFEYRPVVIVTDGTVGDTNTTILPKSDDDVIDSRVIMEDNYLRHDITYRYFYNTALYGLIIYAAPLSIVTALNVRLVRVVTTARRHWSSLSRNQRHELKATVLPLVIVLVFAVCGTFSLFGFVFDAIYTAANYSPDWLQVYTAVGNCLVIFNSAINFVLMLFFGNKFRRMLKQSVMCYWSKTTSMTSNADVNRRPSRSKSVISTLM